MRRRVAIVFTLALAVLALGVACGGEDDEGAGEAAGGESITVDLGEQNSSGESGTATLTADGEATTVTIELTGAPEGTPQPAHIHDGTCTELGDVVYPLTNVEGGTSETTVEAPLADLMGAAYAVNVHESEANIENYVSCGDLPKS